MTYEEYCQKRDSLGLTDYTVSKYSAISRATLSQWKNGNTTPSETTMKRLKFFLGKYDPAQDYPDAYFGVMYEICKRKAAKPVAMEKNPSPLPMPEDPAIIPIPKVFNIDSVSVYLQEPVELSERQYQELVRGTEAYVISWLRLKNKYYD